MDPLLRRLAQLPRMSGKTWQGAMITMTADLPDDADPTQRELAEALRSQVCGLAMWVDPESMACAFSEPRVGDQLDFQALMETFVQLATDPQHGGYLPGCVQVKSESAAAAIRPLLDRLHIPVAIMEELSAIDQMIQTVSQAVRSGIAPTGLRQMPGMTPQILRDFADACAQFFDAEPWKHFRGQQLIEIISPKVDRSLRLVQILGQAEQEFGASFFRNVRDFKRLYESDEPMQSLAKTPLCGITAVEASLLPADDLAAWRELGLPTVMRGQYPLPMIFRHDGFFRPDAAILVHMEGILRAIARAIRERAFGTGTDRWRGRVPTAGGEQKFSLRLLYPFAENDLFGLVQELFGMLDSAAEQQTDLSDELEDDDEQAPERSRRSSAQIASDTTLTPSQRANMLAEQAWEAGPPAAIELAQQALKLDPNCSEAYLVLGSAADTNGEAIAHFRRAVAAAEQTLGQDFFQQHTGDFWGLIQTRPYMRAMHCLAEELRDDGQFDEAISVYQRMLELNPDDNQGIRDSLASLLLRLERHEELRKLLDRYPEDCSLVHCYSEALLLFRQQGASDASRNALRQAIRYNPYLPEFLLGKRRPPRYVPEFYSPGDDNEARTFAGDLVPCWRATPGAVEWLKAQLPGKRPGSSRRNGSGKAAGSSRPKPKE
ncbi:tetratricopeptide repeat protein [Fontivita pretiosa]|uniref:tetratricopeptide repeat protein n=1 Tax=Fontivita pretiosa TaxID=2989684 RepID=UPI003D18656D